MKKYGIVAIGYNRPDSMNRLLSALECSDYMGQDISLIVSIDNCGNDAVEQAAKAAKWSHGDKIVRTFPERQGLRNHILKCGSYMEEYDLDAVAVFEDDVVPAPVFFSYMTQCVEQYGDNESIAGISLYSHRINVNAKRPFLPQPSKYDVFFMQFAQSWGQVWMREQWKAFSDWYASAENDHIFHPGKLPSFVCRWPKTSWLKYHIKYCVEKNKYFVYPYFSYATCYSEAGEHTGSTTSRLQVPMQTQVVESLRLPEQATNGIVYDAFFEYRDDSDVCFDIYGMKTDYSGKSKVLTAKKLPWKVLSTYALTLKPHEMNYLNGLPGDGLYLYEVPENATGVKDEGPAGLGTVNYYYNYFPTSKQLLSALRMRLKIEIPMFVKRAIRKFGRR